MSSSVPVSPAPSRPLRSSLTRGPFLLLVGLLCIVASAKLWLITLYGSDVPQIDEWAATFHLMVRGDVHGEMAGNALWWSHGEHHPVIARWIALHSTRLNAQWDARVPMLATLLLYLGFAGGVWALARRIVAERFQPATAVALAVLLAAPRNYENFLWGFQSQFIGALTFGIWHLYGTLTAEKPGVRWWLAQAAGVCGLFTIAAGTVAPAALALLGAWTATTTTRRLWGWSTFVANAVLVGWGYWLLRQSHYDFNHSWPSITEIVGRVGRLTAWPHWPSAWALVALLPLGGLLALRIRQREFEPRTRLILGLLTWAGGLQLAIALGRDVNVLVFAIRYADLVLPLSVALVLAAGVLLDAQVRPPLRWPVRFMVVTWALVVAWAWIPFNWPPGVAYLLTELRRDLRRQELAVRLYQRDGDVAHFAADERARVRFPHLNETREILDDPKLARYLPPTYQRPLVLTAAPETHGFTAQQQTLDSEIAWVVPTFVADAAQPARFRSEPIDAEGRPFLRLRVRGVLDGSRNWIALETADGRRLESKATTLNTGDRWQIVNLPAPRGPVRLVAEAAAGTPLAFTAPITVGRLSWLAPKISRTWPAFLSVGVLALLAGIVLGRQAPRAPGSSATKAASDGVRESERQIA